MKIGFIGLGKMGLPMVGRLIAGGHEVVATARHDSTVQKAIALGAMGSTNLQDVVTQLGAKPVVWLMIPSEAVDEQLDELIKMMPSGIIIDGGNSDYRNTVKRAELLKQHNLQFMDVGTSGGVLGAATGYAMMIGGESEAVQSVWPLFEALGIKDGYRHVGPSGAGHYVKMVHNAIEYGMMQSYAEGYRLLKEGPIAGLDLGLVGNLWQHGSIVQSLLNQLTAEALEENPELEGIDGYVAESGEARWALETAKELKIPTPAIQAAFDVRLASQKGDVSFATKVLAAMRNKFGGHALNK